MKTEFKSLNTVEPQETKREISSDRQLYLPRGGINVRSTSEALLAAKQPAGRFSSPLTPLDRLTLDFRQRIAEISETERGDSVLFDDPTYPVGPQWQAVLNYLRKQGVIASPRVLIEGVFHDEPKLFSLRLFAQYGRNDTDGYTTMTPGYSRGISDNFEEALSKVIGELLERYPLTIYRRRNLIRASMQSLARAGKRFLNIHDLTGFSDWQQELLPERKFDETSDFHWVEGVELLSGKPALIPAQLVYWNYDTRQEPAEPHLREQNTNGAAGHFTYEESILAAIYENIQRDAFLIHWLNNIPPSRIDPNNIDHPAIRRLLDEYKRYGLEVVLLNTTLDLGVPSCIAVLIDVSGRGPRIALGGGCDPDFGSALLRSVTEVWSIHHWLRLRGETETFTLAEPYQPFRDNGLGQWQRCLLWADDNMFPHFEPFLRGPLQAFQDAVPKFSSSFASPKEELDAVLRVFRALGREYKVYAYEAKHEILSTLGYHSVRVVIPGLVPIYMREGNAPLAAPRLRETPIKKGHQSAREFISWPHPFP